jgi:hypothetical protein
VNYKSIGIETSELPGSKINPVTYQNLLDLVVDICIRHEFLPTPDFVQPHSKYDDIERRYDPFRWVDFVNGKANPGLELFNPFAFYSDLKELYLKSGGKSF